MVSENGNGNRPVTDSAWSVFLIFLRLGLTSFGGPIAHLGYFRAEFVAQRHWLSEKRFADLVALCQFLPGPASSQVGIALGLSRAGYGGALAAWLGFTLPSALMLTLLALGLTAWGNQFPAGVLHGLKVAAVAVVAQAVWAMAKNLCTDTVRISIAAIAAFIALLLPNAWGQIGLLIAAAIVGWMCFKSHETPVIHDPLPVQISRRHGSALLALFFFLLLGLPIAAEIWPNHLLQLIDVFYRAGSLIFGGGHVMLPLLQAAVVPNGWVENATFMAGYGATQAVPGPLSTFAAFLGASLQLPIAPWLAAAVCLVAIFAPSFLLVMGALPFWEQLRHSTHTQAALAGVNAAVVGILLAALYQPVWTSAVYKPQDFGMVVIAFVALMFWKLPPWLVVLASGAGGWLYSAV